MLVWVAEFVAICMSKGERRKKPRKREKEREVGRGNWRKSVGER